MAWMKQASLTGIAAYAAHLVLASCLLVFALVVPYLGVAKADRGTEVLAFMVALAAVAAVSLATFASLRHVRRLCVLGAELFLFVLYLCNPGALSPVVESFVYCTNAGKLRHLAAEFGACPAVRDMERGAYQKSLNGEVIDSPERRFSTDTTAGGFEALLARSKVDSSVYWHLSALLARAGCSNFGRGDGYLCFSSGGGDCGPPPKGWLYVVGPQPPDHVKTHSVSRLHKVADKWYYFVAD